MLHMLRIFIRLLIIVYSSTKFKREFVNKCLFVI